MPVESITIPRAYKIYPARDRAGSARDWCPSFRSIFLMIVRICRSNAARDSSITSAFISSQFSLGLSRDFTPLLVSPGA